jgi:hypothetical protein
MAYTDGSTKIGGGVKVVERLFQTEAGVATFAGTGRVEGDGLLLDIAIILDGTTPPNSLVYTFKDNDGLTIKTATITANTARPLLTANVAVFGGINITLSGNTTNNAKGKIKFYFAA